MSQNAAQNYLRMKVLTATPEQLQLMLYDGAIRFAEQGRLALQEKNYELSFDVLCRAQKIIAELIGSLKHNVAPELCAKLASLYGFVYRKLVEGNTQRLSPPIEEALRVLRYQRETWALLLDQMGKQKAAKAA